VKGKIWKSGRKKTTNISWICERRLLTQTSLDEGLKSWRLFREFIYVLKLPFLYIFLLDRSPYALLFSVWKYMCTSIRGRTRFFIMVMPLFCVESVSSPLCFGILSPPVLPIFIIYIILQIIFKIILTCPYLVYLKLTYLCTRIILYPSVPI